jgi:hypothetical protein
MSSFETRSKEFTAEEVGFPKMWYALEVVRTGGAASIELRRRCDVINNIVYLIHTMRENDEKSRT